ncbi:hypothetical protein ACP4OV_006756 [Aristida adscensionis]
MKICDQSSRLNAQPKRRETPLDQIRAAGEQPRNNFYYQDNRTLVQQQNNEQGWKSQKEKDEEFLEKMRGWLVTVATLFVGMAYQAAMRPPDWMAKVHPNWARVIWHPQRRRALSRDERNLVDRAFLYQVFNTITFSSALGIVVLLLVMGQSSPSSIVRSVTWFLAAISFCVAANFIVGITYFGAATAVFSIIMAVFVAHLAFIFICQQIHGSSEEEPSDAAAPAPAT